jgi:membrane associated rhomboid family serine protease
MAEHYEQENEQQKRTRQDISREWRYVVCGVVGANCVVFLMWQATSIRRFMAKNFAISSAGVLKEGRLHTLVTSIVSHYDAVHLGANMACLVIFGKSLMPILGRSRFLALYLGAGIASSLAQVAWPVVAPDHLRYSPYQLGLGARFVRACACVCVCVCVCVRVAAFGNFPYQPGLGRQVEA